MNDIIKNIEAAQLKEVCIHEYFLKRFAYIYN